MEIYIYTYTLHGNLKPKNTHKNIIKRKESNQKTKGKRSREEKNRTKSTKKQIQWQ